jgi:MFS family permease
VIRHYAGTITGDQILDGKKGWLVVFGSVWALTITSGVGFFSMAVLAEQIIVNTGWSEEDFTTGTMVWGLSAALFSPFCGKAIDSFGSRIIMIIGIVVAAAAEFSLAYVNTLPQFYLALAILATGVVATTYIPIATVVGHWFVKKASIATGISMLGLGIGGGLFPVITKTVLDANDYQTAFMTLACIMMTALIPVFIWIRLPDKEVAAKYNAESDEPTSDHPDRDLTLTQALKSRSFWGLNLGDMLTSMVFAVFNILLVLYMTNDTGDADHATLVFSVLSFGIGFGILIFGPLGEIFNFRRIFVLCYFLPSVGTVLLVVSGAPLAAYSFAVIAGFAGGGRSALFPAAILNSFGGTHMASIYGVANTLFMIGTAVGPPIATKIYESSGKTSTVYLVCVITLIISAFLVSLIRDERAPAKTEPAS